MHTLPLDGIWSLACPDDLSLCGPDGIPAPVPGSVHDALLDAGLIPDAHHGCNERDQLWVGDRAWSYRRVFTLSAGALAAAHHDLVCDGLDTFCTVLVNGVEVGRADNMFRAWRFSVKDALREGANELRLVFASPKPVMEAGTAGHHLGAWNELANSGWWGPTGRGYVRKQACQFGWDWGMQSPSAGPWKSLRLESWNTARIDEWRITQLHQADGRVALRVFLQPDSGAPLRAEAELLLDGKPVAAAAGEFCCGWEWEVTVPSPRLWWPNGLGDQPLYTLRLTLLDAAGARLDERVARLGLRQLELVREPDEWGRSFYFKVNGLPFFAKGTNWIPLDSHPSARRLDERYRRDLGAARDAHMNLIRVWGGGYFSHDEFYDRCDELGLLVWQDLMFGCGAYPAWKAGFRESIWRETVDNARRLRHHACLACWCGNNELEQGFTAPAWRPYDTASNQNGTIAWASYEEIFERVLPSALALADPVTPWFRGSPHCAPEDGRDGKSERSGDLHIWEVWFSDAPFEVYRRYPHRFLSEFGFQALPDADTLRAYAPQDEELSMDSPWMAFRQRSSPGMARIREKIGEWFGPATTKADFDTQCVLSQLVQGLGLKIGIEYWRTTFPRAGGATYWQLNDRWAAPTWSTLDVHGRWKAGHHLARRFFAPLSVIGIETKDTGSVRVFIVNDRATPIPGTLMLDVISVNGPVLGSRVLRSESGAASVPFDAGDFSLADLCGGQAPAHEDVIVWLRFAPDDTALAPVENQILFVRPGALRLRPADVRITNIDAVPGSDCEAALTLVNGATPALWAHVAPHPAVVYVENNFSCLRPGETRVLRLRTGPGGLGKLRATLGVRCALAR